jgi:PAS domain S-box-containing protein
MLVLGSRAFPAHFLARPMSDVQDGSRVTPPTHLPLDSAILSSLMDAIPDRIYFKDLESRFVRNNAAHARGFGTTPEACVGKSDFDFFSREHAERARADELEIIRTGQPVIAKAERITKRDGTKGWASSTKLPWRDASGRIIGTFGLSRDITALKEAEEKLTEERNLLMRSNAELEQFAYVASHDLQEPLRAVTSCVQLLKKRYEGKLDARADEFITHAVEGTKRMQALIVDLLAYSRVSTHSHPFETAACGEVLDEALANLSVALQESGAVVTHEPDPLPTIVADASQLAQVFQNLIANAIKFRAEGRKPEIRITVKRGTDEWVFAVADNGIGIEPQYFERIFRMFQRLHTRARYPGTGIGLAICKKVIERHGGRMWLESQPEQGSTFYFNLPDLPPAPATP